MRLRIALCCAVLSALLVPAIGRADPKPAGCGGVVSVTGRTCTFVLEAGNQGMINTGVLAVGSGAARFRLELLRGSTIVYRSEDLTTDPVDGGGRFTLDDPLPGGTYTCRVTILSGSPELIAYACSAA